MKDVGRIQNEVASLKNAEVRKRLLSEVTSGLLGVV